MAMSWHCQGGFSYGSSQYDRAMQAAASTGIDFQAVCLCRSARHGYTPVTKVLDAPFPSDMGPGLPVFGGPKLCEKGEFLGAHDVAARDWSLSRNVMTVRLADTIGMGQVVPKRPSRFGVYDSCRHCLPIRWAPR